MQNQHLINEMTERLKYLLASNAVKEINCKIPMDILVYSKAEYNDISEQNTLFFREIRSTGKILYEK